jgi:hypothetical protein
MANRSGEIFRNISPTQSVMQRQGSHDFVTIRRTKGPLATKTVCWRQLPAPQDDSAGEWVITQYGNAKNFSIAVRNVGTIYELAALLTEIERDPRSFIVRGEPVEDLDLGHAYRRVHPRKRADGTVEPATLRPAARHWVPLDIDSIACPEWLDPLHEPDRTVEYVVNQLPEEFHGASCWWSFTSRQGIKSGIYLRLFFWSDRPIEDWELKCWLGDRLPQEGVFQARRKLRYPIDPAIFAPAQPIYVARPIFVGAPDPVPIRSGMWRGDRDAITPPTMTTGRALPRGTHQTGEKPSIYRSGGYEAHRGRIGDHEGGSGFHEPAKTAAAAYIARHGVSVETEWLRADLETAIREAPRDAAKHSDAYIEYRVRDLDSLIRAIFDLQVAKEAGVQQSKECEPTYPAPEATVEEAREQLTRVFDAHVASIAAYAEQRAAYQAGSKGASTLSSLRHSRA